MLHLRIIWVICYIIAIIKSFVTMNNFMKIRFPTCFSFSQYNILEEIHYKLCIIFGINLLHLQHET